MDKKAQIEALRKVQDEIDELSARIDTIVKENEQKITDNVDEICKQIEKDLEEIYEMTDERIHDTRHVYFYVDSYHYALSFDGKANAMYFIDTEKSWGKRDDNRPYHIVIAEHQDGSGKHYYEDGKWRDQRTKEIFASGWAEAKKEIHEKIIQAYEFAQKESLKSCMRVLNDSESRLANVSRKVD